MTITHQARLPDTKREAREMDILSGKIKPRSKMWFPLLLLGGVIALLFFIGPVRWHVQSWPERNAEWQAAFAATQAEREAKQVAEAARLEAERILCEQVRPQFLEAITAVDVRWSGGIYPRSLPDAAVQKELGEALVPTDHFAKGEVKAADGTMLGEYLIRDRPNDPPSSFTRHIFTAQRPEGCYRAHGKEVPENIDPTIRHFIIHDMKDLPGPSSL